METRDFHCKIKSVTDTGTFVGFASTYEKDLQDDIIEPGAFTAAINSQGSGYPLLWNHDPGTPIGKAVISDSKAGLVCKGSLLLPDPGAEKAYRYMQADVVRGLSVGFTIDDQSAVSYDDAGIRHIKSLHLYEISCVAFPANPGAMITSVKSLDQVEKFLRFERARVQKSAAAMDDEMVAHLRAIHMHCLSMLEPIDQSEEEQEEGDLVPGQDPLAYELSALVDELKALTTA